MENSLSSIEPPSSSQPDQLQQQHQSTKILVEVPEDETSYGKVIQTSNGDETGHLHNFNANSNQASENNQNVIINTFSKNSNNEEITPSVDELNL